MERAEGSRGGKWAAPCRGWAVESERRRSAGYLREHHLSVEAWPHLGLCCPIARWLVFLAHLLERGVRSAPLRIVRRKPLSFPVILPSSRLCPSAFVRSSAGS